MVKQPIIFGRDAIVKHFKDSKRAHWKLYNASNVKSPVMIKTDQKNVAHSLAAFSDLIESIDPNGVYILDLFVQENGQDRQYFTPETSIPFTLVDRADNESIAANNSYQPAMAGTGQYTPEFGEHIALIKANAQLSAENDYSRTQLADALDQNNKLIIENGVLEERVEELENGDEEEEKEDGIFSGLPANINQSLANLIEKKGPMILENMFASDNANNYTKPINGSPVEEDANIYEIVKRLKKHDPQIEEHLLKLLGIAEHMPDTFKDIMSNLDNWGGKTE